MASSRIPEDVAKYCPGPCTEIKPIGGHYYVYMGVKKIDFTAFEKSKVDDYKKRAKEQWGGST